MPRPTRTTDNTTNATAETELLREGLTNFFNKLVTHPVTGQQVAIGSFKWGVYAFFDFDDEPIYVGQTKEGLRTRIRRHMTNMRTDAVAMKVLDPYEVYRIEVWPYFGLEDSTTAEISDVLNSLEYKVFNTLLEQSHFGAVLNEKDPVDGSFLLEELPESFGSAIVPDEVLEARSHPDVRIARRASILAGLAQIISERQVQAGLRNTLWTQAKRLEWLAERRVKGRYGEDTTDLMETPEEQ